MDKLLFLVVVAWATDDSQHITFDTLDSFLEREHALVVFYGEGCSFQAHTRLQGSSRPSRPHESSPEQQGHVACTPALYKWFFTISKFLTSTSILSIK
jgi:hypothetical protein